MYSDVRNNLSKYAVNNSVTDTYLHGVYFAQEDLNGTINLYTKLWGYGIKRSSK